MVIRRDEPNCGQVCDRRGAGGFVRRIGDVRQSRSSNGEILRNWAGICGSTSTATRETLLNGFEVLEHVLSEALAERSNNIKALARKITKSA
jgi:hypothetical protein